MIPAGGLFDITGRIVIVTGGLGQLGLQYSGALVQSGARVVVLDPAPGAAGILEQAGLSHERLLYLEADVTSSESLKRSLAAVQERWGVPFGLINNAALDSPPDAPAEENGPFETYPEASWEKVMEVNVKGVMLCCQVFGGVMARAGRGSIVNIGSTYGMVSPDQRLYHYRKESGAPFFKPIAYSASKSAVLNMTRYLATYFGGSGVRVNTLTLGGVFNNQDHRFLEEYCSRVPLGRMARPAEYNGAVLFLMSDASAYMTGANMVMDGGWTAW